MSLSSSNLTVTNLELAPMRVTWNGVDLGGTLGNVKIVSKYTKADLKVDQLGDTVVNRVVKGYMAQITTEIAEVKNKDNWKVVFPNINEVTSGTKLVQFANKISQDDYSLSQILLLHPLNKSDADLTQDYTFYKTLSSEESEIDYSPSGQAKLKIVWNVYPNFGVTGYPMFIHGDPSVGLISASAGSATPGSNTGNGTVGTITVANGFTKSETITITCVGQTGGNNFDVSGSVSGPLGGVHVGATNTNTGTFTSNPVNFIITQGSVQFAVNDSFTIVTTAANYV